MIWIKLISSEGNREWMFENWLQAAYWKKSPWLQSLWLWLEVVLRRHIFLFQCKYLKHPPKKMKYGVWNTGPEIKTCAIVCIKHCILYNFVYDKFFYFTDQIRDKIDLNFDPLNSFLIMRSNSQIFPASQKGKYFVLALWLFQLSEVSNRCRDSLLHKLTHTYMCVCVFSDFFLQDMRCSYELILKLYFYFIMPEYLKFKLISHIFS